jgi:hypothetical protein
LSSPDLPALVSYIIDHTSHGSTTAQSEDQEETKTPPHKRIRLFNATHPTLLSPHNAEPKQTHTAPIALRYPRRRRRREERRERKLALSDPSPAAAPARSRASPSSLSAPLKVITAIVAALRRGHAAAQVEPTATIASSSPAPHGGRGALPSAGGSPSDLLFLAGGGRL